MTDKVTHFLGHLQNYVFNGQGRSRPEAVTWLGVSEPEGVAKVAVAAQIVMLVAAEYLAGRMVFCVYAGAQVPLVALDAIREAFADEKYELKISSPIDIWNAK